MDVMDSNMLYLLVYVIFGFGICIYIKKKFVMINVLVIIL